jgi:hypothetical protein
MNRLENALLRDVGTTPSATMSPKKRQRTSGSSVTGPALSMKDGGVPLCGETGDPTIQSDNYKAQYRLNESCGSAPVAPEGVCIVTAGSFQLPVGGLRFHRQYAAEPGGGPYRAPMAYSDRRTFHRFRSTCQGCGVCL